MFEWDEEKNKRNFEKHGISFEEASLIFEGPILSWTDDRSNYGETRMLSIGLIRNTVAVTVVHTDRTGNTRLISARIANRKERDLYNGHH